MTLHYEQYRDDKFNNRFITHKALQNKILSLKANTPFSVEQIGTSAGGRQIYCLCIGSGNHKILLWSQMHGDEATATLALIDLFNFFTADDQNNPARQQILNACTLYFIPMLNPDGAEKLTRRNAQGIDINRDFLAGQSPEGQILKQTQQRIQPHFGFNLHDQHSLWSVSGTKKPATISLLAPPADAGATLTPTRLKAIQLVAAIHNLLQAQIPGHVGRWDETFEPRAFGDNFQQSGMATVLIESGGYVNDPERQFARKLNFHAILFAIQQIAAQTYLQQNRADYYNIPVNNKELFHLLINNCRLNTAVGTIKIDIGLNYTEKIDIPNQTVTPIYTIADIGDLSTWNAYENIDANEGLIEGNLTVDLLANFILNNGEKTIICFENGIIVSKNH